VEIIDSNLFSIPLSTSYVGDAGLKMIARSGKTEEGYTFFDESYLKNATDRKINNYSSIYLTNKQKCEDILYVEQLSSSTDVYIFNTSIVDKNGLYLTASGSSYFFTEKEDRYVILTDRIFEFHIDEQKLTVQIVHRSKDRINYYLNSGSNFGFTTNPSVPTTIFNYVLDKNNNKIGLFQNSKIVTTSARHIVFEDDINSFNINNFSINYYIQHLTPKINTSWVSYDKKHKNAYDINPIKSRNNLENNYLISTQYSNITGNTIYSNILTLKNQHTHKNYSYRSNYLEKVNPNVPSVDNRDYIGLFTGNNQETGDYGITLSYEFYNSDYKFEKDKYTAFTTPKSLYPYEQININDLEWNHRGSIAGENPYMSDKIFQKRDAQYSSNAEYLCSWLHQDRNGTTTWLDRYYYPEKTSYAEALATSFNYTYIDPINNLLSQELSSSEYYDVPDVYNTNITESENTPQTDKSALYGISFFDKRSDLFIAPDKEYIYHRIGDVYVDTILKTIQDSLILNGLSLKDNKRVDILLSASDIDSLEYQLDGNTFSEITNYGKINNSHQFTICFWMQSDDWTNEFGHQIVGNLNNKGFALLDDEKITPIITIQANNKVYSFNTDFDILDSGSLSNEQNISNSFIKDIYRTDHLDSFYTINIE